MTARRKRRQEAKTPAAQPHKRDLADLCEDVVRMALASITADKLAAASAVELVQVLGILVDKLVLLWELPAAGEPRPVLFRGPRAPGAS